jgi:hypothetical protein
MLIIIYIYVIFKEVLKNLGRSKPTPQKGQATKDL